MSMIYGLNDKQREAVTSAPVNTMILAGAGSGKTRVLVTRIAWLVQEHAFPPETILAVTFTNKAASEMKERLEKLLDSDVDRLWVGTFHSICHRLLRRHCRDAALPSQFNILDADDQARILKQVMASLGIDTEQYPVKPVQYFINAKKDEGLRAAHLPTNLPEPIATYVKIYQAYEIACQRAGVIDFAEILLRAHELLRDNDHILQQYHRRFQAVLVDEFQDTNTIQYAFIQLLAGQHAAVMAVGDDDQSIYGWRGAQVGNIKRFVDDFSPVSLIRLEQNYRSTATILNAANALIANNDGRMGKELWTELGAGEKIGYYAALNELDEAYFVADRIRAAVKNGHSPLDIAILYRSNAQSRVLEDALMRAGVAYRIYGGLRFFERAEIKDALAYLRLMLNPQDDTAFLRVVNFPTRGVGEKTLNELRTVANRNGSSLWQAALLLIQQAGMAARARIALEKFIHLIQQLQVKIASLRLEEQIHEVIVSSGLYDYFAKIKADKSESRLENLQELINAAREFDYEQEEEGAIEAGDSALPLLAHFLAHTALQSGEMTSESNENSSEYIHMMTLHAAKGLEFPYVFLTGMEEGLFPSKQSLDEFNRLEEERRLCYVGLTRAKEQIVLTYATVRRQYGREERHLPSRFLKEIPKELLQEISSRYTQKNHLSTQNRGLGTDIADIGYRLGQEVQHAIFGPGVVLAIEGQGAQARVQVNFEQVGPKWLVLAYAKLT